MNENRELLVVIHKDICDSRKDINALRDQNDKDHEELRKDIVGLRIKQVIITVFIALTVSGGTKAILNFIKVP